MAMLRTTAVRIINEPMTPGNCFKAETILKQRFTPYLSWAEKSKLIYNVHVYKDKLNFRWKMQDTADYLHMNYFHVAKCIRLWKMVLKYPNLEHIPDIHTADQLSKVKQDQIASVIDQILCEKGIFKGTLGVTE